MIAPLRWRRAGRGRRAARLLLILAAGAAPAAAQAPRGSGGVNAPAQRDKPYVVMVSFDGFRADYLDRPGLPAFHRMMRAGTRATGLTPIFPSKTFPNHYAIVTGLYAEHSGLVANTFYDPVRRESYAVGNPRDMADGTWYRGEPLWVTAERQGMVAASFFWPTSDAAISGVRPTRWKTYDGAVPDSARVDSVLTWLALPAAVRPHFVTTYFSDMDDAGHRYGPGAPQVDAALQRVDSALGQLLDGIARLPVASRVYVILVSDHGMARTGPAEFTALERVIDTAGVRVAADGPVANLWVAGGAARARLLRDSLNRRLAHGRAYLRADLPARYHYAGDPRAGDVVVVMDEPYTIGPGGHTPASAGGAHGWDPADPAMQGILLVSGPGVRAGARIPSVANVDIYPLVTRLLGLTPARSIDGHAGVLAAQLLVPGRSTH